MYNTCVYVSAKYKNLPAASVVISFRFGIALPTRFASTVVLVPYVLIQCQHKHRPEC